MHGIDLEFALLLRWERILRHHDVRIRPRKRKPAPIGRVGKSAHVSAARRLIEEAQERPIGHAPKADDAAEGAIVRARADNGLVWRETDRERRIVIAVDGLEELAGFDSPRS